MSGLVALLGPEATAADAGRMLAAAPHRGTDCVVHQLDGAAVGIQRLGKPHPFTAAGLHAHGGVAVAVTGCLYGAGTSILSGDEAARTIAEGYFARGRAALEALNGSFTLVVADSVQNTLTALRSASGERPCFWRSDGGVVALASEVKQLVAAPLPRPVVDEDTLLDMVTLAFERTDDTCYQGVRRLRASGLLEAKDGRVRVECLRDPEKIVATSRIGVRDAVAAFEALLRQAVERRLDDTTALLLSGGLDSSAIAAVAAPVHQMRYGRPLQTVSATYPAHPAVDESQYVRATAQRLGCEVSWVSPEPEPLAELEREAALHDGPDVMPLAANLRWIFSAARAEGHATFLDGTDGDTLLGGQAGVMHALLRRGRIGTAAAYLSFYRRRRGLGWPTTLRRVLVPAVAQAAPAARRAYHRFRPPTPAFKPVWLNGWAPTTKRESWECHEASHVAHTVPRALEYLERVALDEHVTLLHPLADPDLVDFLVRLPPQVKLAGGQTKALVRLACTSLPAEVTGRVDKTLFNDVAVAGASSDVVREAVRAGPRMLGFVDWDGLDARLQGGPVLFPERAYLGLALSADRFLALS